MLTATEAAAIALAYTDGADSMVADGINAHVWERLHDCGYVETVRDHTGEGRTVSTLAGRKALAQTLALEGEHT